MNKRIVIQLNKQIDRTYLKTDRHTVGQTDEQTDRQIIDRQIDKQIIIQLNRQLIIQFGKQIDRLVHIQKTNRWTYRHKKRWTNIKNGQTGRLT